METTLFEALTGAFGDGLALSGGARQTRLTSDAAVGDLDLQVERTAGLPAAGQVSVGRVTYAYARTSATRLRDVSALVGGNSTPGVVAAHPALSPVLDVSRQFSEQDGLRSALFLDTASGEDLANLGRSLGVLRNPMLSDDDQYRQVIRALAYARRGTRGALEALLDAVVGPGKYVLEENPFSAPGTVTVMLPPNAPVSKSALGKSYASVIEPRAPASDGTFSTPLPAFGHGALVVAPLSVQQAVTAAKPSQAAPAGTWQWTTANEADDVQLLAEPQAPTTSTVLVSLNGAYRSQAAQLAQAMRTELALVCRVVRPTALGATLGSAGARLRNRDRLAAWAARAQGGGTQVALVHPTTRAILSAWANLPAGYAAVALRLTAQSAILLVDGRMVGRVAASALPSPTGSAAIFGNTAAGAAQGDDGGKPQLWVRSVGLAATPTADLWQGQGVDGQAVAPDQLQVPSGGLAARHVGHSLILSGGSASRGRNNGTWRIVAVTSPTTCRVQGEVQANGTMTSTGGELFFSPADPVLRYPDDLGKVVTVLPGGATQAGSYTITALYEAGTGKDLANYATPSLVARAGRAKVTGNATPSAGLRWRLDPAMVAETGLTYVLSDAGEARLFSGGQQLVPWRPLPSAMLAYVLPARRVLGGTVRTRVEAYNKVADAGPPVRLLVNPIYAHAPLDALDQYLPQAAGAGVDVVLRS